MPSPVEPENGAARRRQRRINPLIGIAAVIAGLIVFVILSGDRGETSATLVENPESSTSDTIDRNLLVPPGMHAREYIDRMRAAGKPYPLDEVFARAGRHLAEGSLADAHLLYFFAAREDYLPAIMTLGEMADPTRFEAADSLLDEADAVQAHKWYRKAADLGHPDAGARVDALRHWAQAAAEAGDADAAQLLLIYR